MKIKTIFLLILMEVLISCYRVKEYSFLFINFPQTNIKNDVIKIYIDSVFNKNQTFPDSIKDIFLSGTKLNDRERLLHFKGIPDEWYMVKFDSQPCWIATIYSKALADTLIDNKELLGNKEINRIKIRFSNEILAKALSYGKAHNLPDSIIFSSNRFQ